MPAKITNLLVAFLAVFSFVGVYAADEFQPFSGEFTSDNINVRSDSTISAQSICRAKRGDAVKVVSGSYDWYKIRLPKNAPSFIKKDYLTLTDDKTAKAAGDNVNIRLAPDESSPILGRINHEEQVNILGLEGEWYRIEPVKNSFGWVHKKFIKKIGTDKEKKPEGAVETKEPAKEPAATAANTHERAAAIEKMIRDMKTDIKTEQEKLTEKSSNTPKLAEFQSAPQGNPVSVEGILKPYGKVVNRIATHKLLLKDGTAYLIKGDKGKLNAFTYRRVKITGRIASPPENKYPVFEAENIESLN